MMLYQTSSTTMIGTRHLAEWHDDFKVQCYLLGPVVNSSRSQVIPSGLIRTLLGTPVIGDHGHHWPISRHLLLYVSYIILSMHT